VLTGYRKKVTAYAGEGVEIKSVSGGEATDTPMLTELFVTSSVRPAVNLTQKRR